jgi:Zn finger protein HypA/HybF involved in hydrogenase expression
MPATITQEHVDAIWRALWDRGYDSYELVELLAEEALKNMAYGADMATAVRSAEQACGVGPRQMWCSKCKTGEYELAFWDGRCPQCWSEAKDT